MRRAVALLASVVLIAGCGGGDGDGGTAPAPTGRIAGRVTLDGAGVPGAAVAVDDQPAAVTDADGRFAIGGVAAGARQLALTPPAGLIAERAGGEFATVAVGADGEARADFALVRGVQVRASGSSFFPADVTVPAGARVRWVNGGGSHTVTPDDPARAGSWTDAALDGNASFEHVFPSAGTHPYHCRPHQATGMIGTIAVLPPS